MVDVVTVDQDDGPGVHTAILTQELVQKGSRQLLLNSFEQLRDSLTFDRGQLDSLLLEQQAQQAEELDL